MGNAVKIAHGGARSVELETQIKRFERGVRRRLRKFTRTSSRHGDLLYTFPAAAFSLVSGRGTVEQRAVAAGLVRDGASLTCIAEALALPMWTRRLPPEAFAGTFGSISTSAAFGRKITGNIPTDVERLAPWFRALIDGLESADEDFALWLTKRKVFPADVVDELPVRPLAMFAWYSGQDDCRGQRLITRAWTRQARFSAAVRNMADWYERVVVDLTRADLKRGPGRYSGRRRKSGLVMIPLRSIGELRAEGEAMDNCVGSYGGMVAARECFIYSVRRGGRRVATMEVRFLRRPGGGPRIFQLEGPSNVPADVATWSACEAWLADQDGFVSGMPSALLDVAVDATRWKALWLPYLTAKGAKGGLKERPDPMALRQLVGDIERLIAFARL